MVAFSRQSLIRNIPAIGGVLAGVVVAAFFLLISTDALESLVVNSGVASLVPAAAPPLGSTARVMLAFAFGALAASVLWSALFLLFGPGGLVSFETRRSDGVPVIRRADAHPDAPPRKPMSASDLGTPMMDVPVPERPLPRDLDEPLSAFDPGALLPEPLAPVRPVTPLKVVPDREPELGPITTFELTPMVRPVRDTPEPVSPPTIEALLRRLEQGAGRRSQAV